MLRQLLGKITSQDPQAVVFKPIAETEENKEDAQADGVQEHAATFLDHLRKMDRKKIS